jgi:hypothetical protein
VYRLNDQPPPQYCEGFPEQGLSQGMVVP